MLKAIGAAIVVFGVMYIRWAAMGRWTDAIGVAGSRGLSPFRIARPYNRWGVDWRCDVWTLCGAFVGVLLGLGIGWALLDSVPLGIVLAGVGALIAGWHYRAVASLLAVERNARDAAEEPHTAEPPELAQQPAEVGGVHDDRVKLAVAAVACGIAAAAVGLSRGDVHGPIAVVGFVAIVLYVAWRVMRITDRRRAA